MKYYLSIHIDTFERTSKWLIICKGHQHYEVNITSPHSWMPNDGSFLDWMRSAKDSGFSYQTLTCNQFDCLRRVYGIPKL